MVDIAQRLTTQLKAMALGNLEFYEDPNVATSAKLTAFFEELVGEPKKFELERGAAFARESRKFAADALDGILLKLVVHKTQTSTSPGPSSNSPTAPTPEKRGRGSSPSSAGFSKGPRSLSVAVHFNSSKLHLL